MAVGTARVMLRPLLVALAIGITSVVTSTIGAAAVQTSSSSSSSSSSYTVETLPVPGASDSFLAGIACPAVTQCVAVGGALGSSSDTALAETLNGTTWSPTLITNSEGLVFPELTGVWCASVTSCVAVGQDGQGTSPRPLVESLSQGSWTMSSPPLPSGAVSGLLSSVTCVSTGVCEATGDYTDSSGDSHALFAALSNGSWSAHTSTDLPGSTTVSVEAVRCFSATSCDAIGYWGPSSTSSNALLETLSGTTWTPTSLMSGVLLRSLWCASSKSCLAVGYDSSSGNGVTEKLAHGSWVNGSMPGVAGGGTGNGMVGVSCQRRVTSCVAIGGWYPPPPNQSVPLLLIETLSHKKWTPDEIAGPSGAVFPLGLACPTVKTCVGVGETEGAAPPKAAVVVEN